jgi:hypothetical protein
LGRLTAPLPASGLGLLAGFDLFAAALFSLVRAAAALFSAALFAVALFSAALFSAALFSVALTQSIDGYMKLMRKSMAA